tara:strand:- start:694 stop:1179 length:486 start_codon:yes stop_codon:yes gene_type:complete
MISHLNKKNKPKIVDIASKKITKREAIAEGRVQFSEKIFKKFEKMQTKKGEIKSVSIIAGIAGAKKTSELIPLCHNIGIENIDISIKTDLKNCSLIIRVMVKNTGKTGVEMEALTGVSISALTIYDMCKSIDKSISIKEIHLVSKKGGKQGFRAKKSKYIK